MRLSKINLCSIGIILTCEIFIGTKANGKNCTVQSQRQIHSKLAQTLPPPPPSSPAPFPSPVMEQEGPELTTESEPGSNSFSSHLQRIKAKLYGAYWCPHCHSQQELFGKEAFTAVNYIECDPKGKDARTRFVQNPQILKLIQVGKLGENTIGARNLWKSWLFYPVIKEVAIFSNKFLLLKIFN